MLIVNDGRRVVGAEKAVLAGLRASTGPGIAISGCYVPGKPAAAGARSATRSRAWCSTA